MKLTPLDIRHKEFKRGMRGYNDVEVDEFLDAVADEYERIFKENIDLGERLEALQDKIAGYKRIEDTLQKTLVSAQASAEELKQNATKQAQLILGDAELKARQLVNDAYTEKQTIEQSMAKLRSSEQDFRFKFRQLLEGYLQQLAEERPANGAEEAVPATPAEEDFIRHAEAIKAAIAREAATAAEALAQVHGDEGDEGAPAEAPGAVEADATGGDDEDEPPSGSPGQRPASDLATIGEGDDLMADVDGGVNENEFKW